MDKKRAKSPNPMEVMKAEKMKSDEYIPNTSGIPLNHLSSLQTIGSGLAPMAESIEING